MKRHPAYGLLVGEGANINDCGAMFKSLDAAGVPIFIKSQNTARGADEVQELRKRSSVPHVVVFRQSGIHDFDRPEYHLSPKEAAAKHLALSETRFPRNLDLRETWFETTNEIAKWFEFSNHSEIDKPTDLRRVWEGQDEQGNPKIFVDNANWMGWFAYEISLLMLDKGYKHLAFSWNTGEPEAWQWETEGVLAYLRLCQQHPDQLGVGIHEYSGVTSGLMMRKADDGTREPVGVDEVDKQNVVGRFQNTLVATCVKHNIAIPKFCVTEGGWEHKAINVGDGIRHLKEAGEVYFQYEQCLGFALWGSVPEYEGIANQVQALFALQNGGESRLTKYLRETQYEVKYHADAQPDIITDTTPPVEVGETTPVPIKVEPPVREMPASSTTKQLIFDHDFALFDGRGEWYDHGNVQIPTGWDEWQGTGDSPLGDGQPWNRLTAPEGVYLSEEMLPIEEREAYLNGVERDDVNGFTYHIFSGGPWHDRQWKRVQLDAGIYELQLQLHGDWASGGHFANKTREGLEDRHALAELFVGDTGKKDWLEMDLVGDNQLTKQIRVTEAGEYDVGWGVYTVWANAGKPNGCFIKGFSVHKVTEVAAPPPPPAPEPMPTPMPPTSPPVGEDALAFVNFESTVDYTNVPPNTPFTVTWTLQNAGTTTWDNSYHFGYTDISVSDTEGLTRSNLGGGMWQPLSTISSKETVAPGETVKISLSLVAPTDAGNYASHWRLFNGQNSSFGSIRWLRIIVK